MGDRGNIKLKYGRGGPVYLYTHWRGYDLPEIVQSALKRGQDRWGDESYLARIIFDELVDEPRTELTGFGISTEIEDNEHDVIVVDLDNNKVSFETEDGDPANSPRSKTYTFSNYVELDLKKSGLLEGY